MASNSITNKHYHASEVYIGKIIKDITEQRGITKSELGRRLYMTAANVHKIFKRKSIDTVLLQKISTELNYDFFRHYAVYTLDNPVISHDIREQTSISYQSKLELCSEKVKMLKKINFLLEEKLRNMIK